MPERRPARRAGFTTIGKSSRSSIAGSVSAAPSVLNAVSENAKNSGVGMRPPRTGAWPAPCRSSACRPARPSPVYGQPEDLEQLLHRAVLAVAAVQRDERDVGLRLAQPLDQVVADVDRDRLVAEPVERVLDARARAQRHLALERRAALEDRDAAHLRPGAPPQRHDRAPGRGGSAASAGARRTRAAARVSPVSVPYSATCSSMTLPMRRMPSRISSSLERGEVEPHRRCARGRRGRRRAPGTNATFSRSARASRSVVSM